MIDTADIFLSTKRLCIRTWNQGQNRKGKECQNWKPETLKTIFITKYIKETSLTKPSLF